MSSASVNEERVLSLHRNPFYVLGATTRDPRDRLIELAEEQSLLEDEAKCRNAQNALTNLRARLGAEMAWLPGVAPRKAAQIVSDLARRVPDFDLSPLARSNVVASIIEALDELTKTSTIVTSIIYLASSVDMIDLKQVLRDLNEDRIVAGFPKIRDESALVVEFETRKRQYRNVVRDLVDKLPAPGLVSVMEAVVQAATDAGARHAPALIQDLVDTYEMGAQAFIEKEIEVAEALISRAREVAKHGEDAVLNVVEDIEKSATNYNIVVKPIQDVRHANGMTHEPSRTLARLIRNLAVDLHNEKGWLRLPTRVTDFVSAHFTGVDEVVEVTATDRAYLDNVHDEKKKAEERDKEFNQSITYAAEIGALIKNKVEISPTGIRWRDNHMSLDQVTRLRWSATRHSVNGIPTGTSFMIFVGNQSSSFTLNLGDREIYDNLVQRFWLAIGFRLFIETVLRLKNNETVQIPGGAIRDDGLTLTRHRIFGANERVNVEWNQVNAGSQNGQFVFSMRGDSKVYASMSYRNDDNVFVIEYLIKMFFNSDKVRPSQILD